MPQPWSGPASGRLISQPKTAPHLDGGTLFLACGICLLPAGLPVKVIIGLLIDAAHLRMVSARNAVDYGGSWLPRRGR